MPRSLRLLAPALLVLAFVQAGEASFISLLPLSSSLAPGASETISVQFTSTENFNLTSGSFAFTIDPTRFSLTNANVGSLLLAGPSGSSATLTRAFDSGYGTFTINGTGAPISTGQIGTLATFTLMALANAPAGGSLGDLNLQASFNTAGSGTVTTQLNNGAIVLTPPPTNGYDPTLDATVIVTGSAAVPEPSSFALCGIAGLTGLGMAWKRRKRAS